MQSKILCKSGRKLFHGCYEKDLGNNNFWIDEFIKNKWYIYEIKDNVKFLVKNEQNQIKELSKGEFNILFGDKKYQREFIINQILNKNK